MAKRVEWSPVEVTVDGEKMYAIKQYEIITPESDIEPARMVEMKWDTRLTVKEGKLYKTRSDAFYEAQSMTSHHSSPLGLYPRAGVRWVREK